jgi:tetratricopeptide (TPR) repeat protein
MENGSMNASRLQMPRASHALVWILFAAFALFTTACESMDRAEAVRKMNEGLEMHQLGRTVDAVRFLKEASQIDPTYAEPAYYLGQIYHIKLDELDNAERFYREALDRDPENPQIAYRLGSVLSDLNNWGEAEAFFQQAVNKDPEFAKAWFRLGLTHEQQNDYASAVDAFMKSINANARMRMDEDDPGGAAYHALGDIYIRFGFYDKALQVYENGILNNDLDSRPEKPARLYQGKGVALLKAKKFSEAAQAFKKALELDGTMYTAIFNLAVANMAMNNTQEAVTGFQQFTQRADPSTDSARIVAAEGFIQQIKEKAEQQEEEKK